MSLMIHVLRAMRIVIIDKTRVDVCVCVTDTNLMSTQKLLTKKPNQQLAGQSHL